MARDKDKNTDQAPEADAEAQASEPSEPAENTEAPKSEKPAGPTAEELQEALQTAVTAALDTADAEGVLTPEATEALQTSYRKIPAARRGTVQANILRAAMGAEGVNPKAVASVLEEMTKAPEPKARATRVAKPDVPQHIVLAQSFNALDIARLSLSEGVDAEVLAQANALAEATLQSGIEDEDTKTAVLTAARKAANAVTVKARKASGTGTSGPRTVKTETLASLVERGALPAGTVLKGGDNTATVTADGKLSIGDKVFDNPTAAAKGAGVTSSVNGWAYWAYTDAEGKSHPVGDLRKA